MDKITLYEDQTLQTVSNGVYFGIKEVGSKNEKKIKLQKKY